MAWPPPALPINRTNADPQQDTHPNDHNIIALAINDLVAELGADPGGAAGTVQQRLENIESFAVTTEITLVTTPPLVIGPGVFDIVVVDPLTRPYNCWVFAIANIRFGNSTIRVDGDIDIFRAADGVAVGGGSPVTLDLPGEWGNVTAMTGYQVAAGVSLAHKSRLAITGTVTNVRGDLFTIIKPV